MAGYSPAEQLYYIKWFQTMLGVNGFNWEQPGLTDKFFDQLLERAMLYNR